MEFAIVDIETTGGHAAGNSITEISINLHNGTRVFQSYQTLIKPDHSIPYYISGLTGITNEMVQTAPSFSEIARDVYGLLNNRVFVAHSVNFDYSFLNAALKRYGLELKCKKLCTVRLSRKIYPGFPSYSLGNLCSALSIPIHNRHRAGGDAEATIILFEKLLNKDSETVLKFLKRGAKEHALPPNLPKSEFDTVPETTGVYYFLNQARKVVYIGKALNIRKRVSGHFSNNSPGKQKQDFMREVFHIKYTECETEAEAFALETQEIKRIWPRFNRAQKQYEPLLGIIQYVDQNGFTRMALKRLKSKIESKVIVSSLMEGYEILRRMARDFELCIRLSGIPKSKERCIEEKCICSKKSKKHIQLYNQKVKEALNQLELEYGTELNHQREEEILFLQ